MLFEIIAAQGTWVAAPNNSLTNRKSSNGINVFGFHMNIEKDGRSTHCYCENPRSLGFRNFHNRDTMGFTTSYFEISFNNHRR